MNIKKRIKNLLKLGGLLKPVTKVVIFLGHCQIIFKSFFESLGYYLYNEWFSNFPSNYVRIIYLRHILGIQIGESCFIHLGSWFHGRIRIGNNSVIGRRCILNGDIVIGNNVSVTAETYIFTSSHIVNSPTFECFYKEVIIQDYAWIGARAMILPGINIGRGAIVGAASTVTKDVTENSIVAGTPAREIGKREVVPVYNLNYSPYFQ